MWVAKNLVVGYSRYYNYVLWAYFIAFLIFVKKKKKGISIAVPQNTQLYAYQLLISMKWSLPRVMSILFFRNYANKI